MKLHISLILLFLQFLATNVNADTSHKVARGETFASIALHYNISEDALRQANKHISKCLTGLSLTIPDSSNPSNSSVLQTENRTAKTNENKSVAQPTKISTPAGVSVEKTAAKWQVVDHQLLFGNLSAKVYSRQDINGRPCAMIKVQLPLTCVQFGGLVVGDVEFKDGEYWVYLPIDAKSLMLKHEQYGQLKIDIQELFADGLAPNTTYSIRVSPYGNKRKVRTPLECEVPIDLSDERIEEIMQILLDNEKLVDAKEYSKAFNLLKPLADIDYPPLLCQIAFHYASGKGVDKNEEIARHYFRRAADYNYHEVYIRLSYMYASPNSTFYNMEMAIAMIDKGLELMPAYFNRKEEEEIRLGYYFKISSCYMLAEEGYPVDYDKVRYYCQKGIDLGSADCLELMGNLYEDGLGVSQDLKKAEQLYKQSAEAGNPDAWVSLGLLYETKYKDKKTAKMYYLKAKELNVEDVDELIDNLK